MSGAGRQIAAALARELRAVERSSALGRAYRSERAAHAWYRRAHKVASRGRALDVMAARAVQLTRVRTTRVRLEHSAAR
jgi:hypothetical protein